MYNPGTTGNDNVAVGYDALINNQGSGNVGIGRYAMLAQNTGGNNIAIGNTRLVI